MLSDREPELCVGFVEGFEEELSDAPGVVPGFSVAVVVVVAEEAVVGP